MIVHSPLLLAVAGLRHGYSTREGGVSRGPYASLNLGPKVGDDPADVEENRRRFVAALARDVPRRGGPAPTTPALELAEAEQVHGATVIDVTHAGHQGVDADGLLTTTAGIAVGVRTADCAPLLLAALGADGQARAVAAVHAGWRGAVAGIAGLAVQRLRAVPGVVSLRAAIGPTIAAADFEVGDEVVEAARASLGGDAPPTLPGRGARLHLDLVGLLVQHLQRAGVPREHIEALADSTTDPSRYYSYRRDRGVTGRHLSAIALI